MSEDSNDILYDIGMQLYDEFNDKIATMNDHLGDVYSFRDIEEVENAQKEREIELLRIAIIKQQKEIEELKEKNRQSKMRIVQLENEITARIEDVNQYYTPNEKIKEEIKDLKLECENCPYKGELCDELNSNNNCVPGMTILILQSLLEKE